MDLLGFLKLLRLVTYSFEGSKNIYYSLIKVRKNMVNFRQGGKSTNKYRIQFWTVVDVLESFGRVITNDTEH